MAKIRKFKLSWKPAESDLLVGYKLYWSIKSPVNYSSHFIKLNKINELEMPDILEGIALSGESIYLGISAVDEMGNESDIITLSEPYNFSVPPAPKDFALIDQNNFRILEQNEQGELDENPIQDAPNQDTKQNVERIDQDSPPSTHKSATSEGKTIDHFTLSIKKALEKNG